MDISICIYVGFYLEDLERSLISMAVIVALFYKRLI